MSLSQDLYLGNDDPLYNIGVVTRMTNISTATLRAWERRYSFPLAKRTAGGHRLYSERDILRLQWVKQRVDEGMQTAQAINALRHQEKSGRLAFVPESIAEKPTQSSDLPALQVYQRRLFNALIRLDLQEADQVLGEALVVASPDDFILDVIAPVMTQVGEAWESQQINIANEHHSTNYLRQRLLMWMLSGPPPRQVPPIVLACAPDEWHEGSLLILGALLRRRRWPVAYLGQAVPLPDLATFVREIKPSAIVFVSMLEETAAALVEWPQYFPEVAVSGWPPVGYGGRIFSTSPEWRLRMMGSYLGSDFRQGIENIEHLIIQPKDR
ncbi:MAG TPA: B12-binding domain-containing protein [Anaerolineales bacterium]|nr:B12-binding domain-containing protein [Anaerolineales bacterium]